MLYVISNIINKITYKLILFFWRGLNFKLSRKIFSLKFIWLYSEKITYERTQIIYLKSHNLLYFAIPKVANSSIKNLFAKKLNLKGNKNRKGGLAYLFNNDIESKKLISSGILVSKSKALELTKTGVESFTVVRDPIQRLESYYNTCVVSPILMKKLSKFYGNNFFWYGMTFDEFSNSVCLIPDIISNRHFLSQNTFIKYKGEIIVNNIFSLEDFDSELSNFLINQGLNFEKIKNVNPGKKKIVKTKNKFIVNKLKNRYYNDYELLKHKQ